MQLIFFPVKLYNQTFVYLLKFCRLNCHIADLACAVSKIHCICKCKCSLWFQEDLKTCTIFFIKVFFRLNWRPLKFCRICRLSYSITDFFCTVSKFYCGCKCKCTSISNYTCETKFLVIGNYPVTTFPTIFQLALLLNFNDFQIPSHLAWR